MSSSGNTGDEQKDVASGIREILKFIAYGFWIYVRRNDSELHWYIFALRYLWNMEVK